MDQYKLTLRKLALRDDRYIDVLLSEECANATLAGIDRRSHALLRIAALIAMDAAPPSFMSAVEAGLDAGASRDEIVGTLIAVLPIVGVARVVSAAPNLGLALGYDVSEALEPRRRLARMFAPPDWLRDLGFLAWFLVGVGILLVGAIWIFATISTILVPVIVGTIAAAVAGPLVDALQRRKVPRAAGAALVLLMLLALGVIVLLLVLGGIVEQGDEIKAYASQALDKVEGWANDAGADDTSEAKKDVSGAVEGAGSTLLHGLASGIQGLTSLAFFVSFVLFSTFFLLKDFSSIRGFVDTHMGIPVPVATTVTDNVLSSLRKYFLGLTIVAAFNGVVVGLGALVLGVSLAGTIAVVTFVTAYVPFIGAFVSGAFAVMIALASEGTGTAAVMLVIVLLANGMLQQVVQPIAFGATLDLNPLAVLFVTIAAGSLFGMIGLILAAPLTSAAVHISRDLRAARACSTGRGTGRCHPFRPRKRLHQIGTSLPPVGCYAYLVGGVVKGELSCRSASTADWPRVPRPERESLGRRLSFCGPSWTSRHRGRV